MAEIDFLLGAAFATQSALGTATTMPTIGSGSGAGGAIDNVTDGAVLGDPSGGVAESGISFSLGRNSIDKAVVSGSFTRDFSDVSARTIDSFEMVVPMKGNGATASNPVVASDFVLDDGIEALYAAAGLTGGPVATFRSFTPTSTGIITSALYFGNEGSNGGRIILRDLIADSLTFDFTPGEIGRATYALSGNFDSYDESGSWPANPFDYGNQSSLSAPFIQGVSFRWGPDTPADRAIGFSELSIAISNSVETTPSSNSSTGTVSRQSGREIVISGTIDATDAEFLYELDQLGESSLANAEALSFTVGTSATVGATCNAYTFSISHPELRSLEPASLGGSQAWAIELVCRDNAANGEFSLIYL